MKARIATLLPAAAALLAAQSAGAAVTYDEADVTAVTPIYRVVESSSPQQECWEEEVVRQDMRDNRDRSYTPGILGMVIGGALGNAVGNNSSSRKVGTVVGAVLGGSVARDIGRANDARRSTVYVDTEERCRTVYNTRQEEKLVGYDVSYEYNGIERTVRMPDDPGSTVRVRVDVEPVL
ncbi:MAG TPA: glycine zipper 2TM domain-containing protein [Pseudomonadales bacterium]